MRRGLRKHFLGGPNLYEQSIQRIRESESVREAHQEAREDEVIDKITNAIRDGGGSNDKPNITININLGSGGKLEDVNIPYLVNLMNIAQEQYNKIKENENTE